VADEVAIDQLFELPLDEFTSARDRLAGDLRAEGNAESAARVKKLRKPSLAAWAVNQLAHRDGSDIERLMELRERIEGAGNAREMRDASEERRRLIADLVARAERLLTDAGHAAASNTIHAITQTLHAGDDEEERAALLRGRLTRELEPTGFGGFGLGFEEPDDESRESDPKIEAKRRQVEDLVAEAEDADREAAAAERGAAEAERALEKARAAAVTARTSADEAARRLDRARKELDRLER
jgi:hypothetical protein